MKYLLSVVYTLVFSVFIHAQTVESHFVNFDFDSFILNDKAENDISKILDLLSTNPEYTVEIIGHTDQDGSQAYNQILADQRAKEVYQYLLDQGIPTNKIQYKSLGEQNLLIAKNDDISKSKNRRVEIITTITTINSLKDLISLLNPNSTEQNFQININHESTILGKKGSKIIIPKDAFVFDDGTSPEGLVEVEIIESFNYSSFAENDLSCMSGNELLESGGMMKISASSNGRNLSIKTGKELAVTYPKSKIKKDMKLFYAEPKEIGASNWIVSESEIQTEFIDQETRIEIDMNLFVKNEIEKPIAPRMDFKRIPSKPRYLSTPSAPFKPIEPKKENINLQLSKWQTITMSSAKKETLRVEKHDEAISKYEQKLDRYIILQPQYEKALINYKIALKQTEQKILEWEELCRIKYSEIYSYQYALRQYKLVNKIWFAQMNLLKQGTLKNDENTFWAFYNLTNRKVNPNEIRIRFQKVFGSNYKKLFNEIPQIGKYGRSNSDPIESDNYKLASKLSANANRLAYKMGYLNQDNMNSNSLGKYAMSVSNLGWINCDRFLNTPLRERRQIAIVHEKDTKFFLIFHDVKSMLTAKKEGQIHEFKGIPSNKNVTVVGLQVIDNQPYLFSKDLTTTENFKLAPTFKKSSVAEISHIFRELDKKAG